MASNPRARAVIGLGNPGPEYAETRHNAGFMVVDALAARGAAKLQKKFSGRTATAWLGDTRLELLEPLTFMNDSGRSAQPFCAWHRIDPTEVVVVHDELDLPFGVVRIKVGGGHGGHNGLRSLVKHLGTGDFVRVRVGIGRPPRGEVTPWVLGRFPSEERRLLPEVIERASEACLATARDGARTAMNAYNGLAAVGQNG
jgi:PTH1 family peptidyl-tRNA hydrolase